MELPALIGNTPLVRLRRFGVGGVDIYVKLEYANPTGSHKDRIAYYMVRDAVERYGLKPGDVVVEASSGNTAISVVFVSKFYSLKPVVLVEEEASTEKVSLLRLMGAEVIKASNDPTSPRYYLKLAREVASERGGVFLNQFENPANIRAHYETTAREIWTALRGRVDCFVMGVGTGGTISGVGRFLKEVSRDVKVVAVTPKGSRIAGGPGLDVIDGLASKNIYPNFDRSVVDEVIEVPRAEAVEMARRLIEVEGILGGISAGANVYAAIAVASKLPRGSVVVTLAPDSAFRYLGTLLR